MKPARLSEVGSTWRAIDLLRLTSRNRSNCRRNQSSQSICAQKCLASDANTVRRSKTPPNPGYLLKPIEFDRFLKASNRAYEKFSLKSLDKKQKRSTGAQPETVFIKSGSGTHQVRPDEILYIEGAGNYVQFVLNGKNVMSLMTMSEVIELLRDYMFVRIHRSYIVAAAPIDVIEPEFVMLHKKKIPIGESYRRNLDSIVNGKR